MAIYRGAGGASDSVDDATVNAVAASAAAAAVSATAAAGSASSAAASAASASGSVASVTTSASNAATSASQAATSASNASTSATSASNDAAAANASSVSASTSASNASNSASAAGISETNAASSASSASTSATNSANSAASALAIYGNTTAMNNAVAAASTSASNAATSAFNAAASAATATTQATNASNSAVASEASKNTAVISSYNAGVSEYNASVSAAAAASAATDAVNAVISDGLSDITEAVATTTTNANNAATSATNASNSATQAAASAASASAIVLGVASGLPSIRPTLNLDFANSGVVDPRITFTRASTGTYYDGKTTAKAEENLVPQSQEFDHAGWSKYQTTVTANSAAAPDGTTTADTITVTSTVGGVYRNVVSGGTQHTASCYFSSAGTAPFPALIIGNNSSIAVFAVFNLAGNVVSQTSATGAGTSIASTSITNVGGNWYRCSITFTLGNTIMNFLKLEFAPTATGNTVDSYGEIIGNTAGQFYYAWGAQLEQRSSVTAYTPTTTQAITNYIPVLQTAASGVPRLDYDPVTDEAKGLLIEESRTNLLTYSSEFDNAAWTKSAATVSANAITAPDGTLTADKLIENTAISTHYLYQSGGAAGTYASSIYAKAGERSWLALTINSTTANFNLANGTLGTIGGGITASITSVGNGWYRCTATSPLSAAGPIVVSIFNGNGVSSYTGDGYSGIYIWGAQLEAGTFATSYIPTTTAQATRAVDSASLTGANFSSWYSQGQGTVYVEQRTEAIAFSNSLNININDGTVSNRIVLGGGSPPTSARSQIIFGGTTLFDSNLTTQVTAGVFGKYAVAFETNNTVFCANGTLGVTDTAVPIPFSVNRFDISSPQRAGYIRSVIYYPKRLTNTELQALTA